MYKIYKIKSNGMLQNINALDNISIIIILRSLFIFSLINAGWNVKLCKGSKNTYQMYKVFKKEI